MQCSGPLSRRFFDQAPRRRRHQRAADPHRAHAGAAARDDRGRRAARARSRQGAHRRHRLRLEPFRQAVVAKGMKPVIGSKPERPRKLAVGASSTTALPRRGLLPQPEALPRHRHALREDRAQLPRARPGRLRVAMAQIGTTPVVSRRYWKRHPRDRQPERRDQLVVSRKQPAIGRVRCRTRAAPASAPPTDWARITTIGNMRSPYFDGGVCPGPFGAGFGVDGGGVVASGSSTGNGP